jgi:DNA modification methylase
MTSSNAAYALNGICPYFTMFPLDFPYQILQHAKPDQWVIDPFCGRGTTNYASRILGLPSIGIDSNPVAVALSQAKLANTSPLEIIQVAQQILEEVSTPRHVPTGEFWEWAYHRDVLHLLCRLREGLLRDCHSESRKALRALLMGALHGPLTKFQPSYFSNQSQRTYAPKPRYAVNFWRIRNLIPEFVDVQRVIEIRAHRYYIHENTKGLGQIIQGDSRDQNTYATIQQDHPIHWVITSPPYYGMRTYLQDQWLRLWFVGGPDSVDYATTSQVSHASQNTFVSELRQVWQLVGSKCAPGAKLVMRFGAINDRKVDSLTLVKQSLKDIGWRIQTIRSAGTASKGRRQALHITSNNKRAIEEHDIWGIWEG